MKTCLPETVYPRVVLHWLAMHDIMINLLAWGWTLRQASKPCREHLRVVIWSTDELLSQSKHCKDVFNQCGIAADIVEIKGIEAAYPTPGRLRDAITRRWHNSPHWRDATNVWAYGGATKPLSIAMWLAAEQLKQDSKQAHMQLYPDQRTRQLLIDEKAVRLSSKVPLEFITNILGGTFATPPATSKNKPPWWSDYERALDQLLGSSTPPTTSSGWVPLAEAVNHEPGYTGASETTTSDIRAPGSGTRTPCA